MKDCDCCSQLELSINGWIFLLYFYFKNFCICLLEWNMCYKSKQKTKHNRETSKQSQAWHERNIILVVGRPSGAFESFLVCVLFCPHLRLIPYDQSCSLRNFYSPPSSHPEGNATSQTGLPQPWLITSDHRKARVLVLNMLQLKGSRQ